MCMCAAAPPAWLPLFWPPPEWLSLLPPLSLPYVLPSTPLPFTLFTRTPLALFRGPLHSSSQSLPDGRACWRLYYAAALNKHLYYILCSVPSHYLPLPPATSHYLPLPPVAPYSLTFRLVSRSLLLVFFFAIRPENGHRFWL